MSADIPPASIATLQQSVDSDPPSVTTKSKRHFFGLGKKNNEGDQLPPVSLSTPRPPPSGARPITPASTPPGAQSPRSPVRSLQPGSPVLAPRPTSAPYTTSPTPPRLSSSSSQIFERNVQEHPNGSILPAPTSPSIPAHIQTDNHIPPVLDASSLAITDQDCGVDEVEIISHSFHQPAFSVAPPIGSAGSHGYSSLDHSEDAGNYSGDDWTSSSSHGADKRRLSFISFADVVQAEQSQQFGDGLYAYTTSSRGSPVQSPINDSFSISTINETLRRSPSPIRLGNSPPQVSYMSQAGESLGERSPGELTIETMREAMNKPGNGDLVPKSPISGVGSFGRS